MTDTAEIKQLRDAKEKIEWELDLAHTYLAGLGKLDHFKETLIEVRAPSVRRETPSVVPQRQPNLGTII